MEDRERIELDDEPGIYIFERPDDVNEMDEEDWREYADDVMEAINECMKDFQKTQVHPSALTDFDPFKTQAQKDSLSLLLIDKGIITQREHDAVFIELMWRRIQELRRDSLPEIRRNQIRAQMNGDNKGLLGADGKPLF